MGTDCLCVLGVGPHQAGSDRFGASRLTHPSASGLPVPVTAKHPSPPHPLSGVTEDRPAPAQILAGHVRRRPGFRRGELGIRPDDLRTHQL